MILLGDNLKKYGKTVEEVDVEKLFQCREIVTEILNFGINETQKRQIIKLLACELESVNDMKDISAGVRARKGLRLLKKKASEIVKISLASGKE
mgnify:CR=1 FL=1